MAAMFWKYIVPFLAFQLMFYWVHAGPDTARWEGPGNLMNISGFSATGFVTQERIDQLAAGAIPADRTDIWVTSYPKSGTTWMQTVVNAINGHANAGNGADIGASRLCPWPEATHYFAAAYTMEQFAGWPKPENGTRCWKSHWTVQGHLKNVVEGRGKVIYVFRRAEEIASSFYTHWRRNVFLFDYAGPFEEWFDHWISGRLNFGTYFEHIASWWKERHRENVLLVHFDDLRADLPRAVRRIAEFMEVPLSPELLQTVVTRSSKKWMAEHEDDVSAIWLTRLVGGFQGQFVGNKPLVVVSDDQHRRIREEYLRVLAPLGVPQSYILSDS